MRGFWPGLLRLRGKGSGGDSGVAEVTPMSSSVLYARVLRAAFEVDGGTDDGVQPAFEAFKTCVHFEYPDITPVRLLHMTSTKQKENKMAEQRLQRLRDHLVLHPRSRTRVAICKLSFLVSFLSGICAPAFFVFGAELTPVFRATAIAMTAVYIVDLLANFITSFQSVRGTTVTSHIAIARRYVLSWFIVDLCVSVPFWIYHPHEKLSTNFTINWRDSDRMEKHQLTAAAAFTLTAIYFKLMRDMLRLRRLAFESRLWYMLMLVAALVSFLQVAAVLFFAACQTDASIFFAMAPVGELREGAAALSEASSLTTRYIVYLHYAVHIVMGKGEPTSSAERVYAIVFNVLGLFFTAIVVGQVTHWIHNRNAKETQWRLKMNDINERMRQQDMSPELQLRIRNYYAFSWAVNGCGDAGHGWLDELSETYHERAVIEMNERLIATVPIFREASADFVHQVILKLEQQLYLPGDYITRHGEPGDAMFFVVRGTVQSMDAEETMVYSVMSEGAFFGEMCFLQHEGKRTATVRAFTYAQLNAVGRDDLEDILQGHPNDEQLLRREAELRERNTENIELIKKKRERSNKQRGMRAAQKEHQRRMTALAPAKDSKGGNGSTLYNSVYSAGGGSGTGRAQIHETAALVARSQTRKRGRGGNHSQGSVGSLRGLRKPGSIGSDISASSAQSYLRKQGDQDADGSQVGVDSPRNDAAKETAGETPSASPPGRWLTSSGKRIVLLPGEAREEPEPSKVQQVLERVEKMLARLEAAEQQDVKAEFNAQAI